jgi:hypothetical protein
LLLEVLNKVIESMSRMFRRAREPVLLKSKQFLLLEVLSKVIESMSRMFSVGSK